MSRVTITGKEAISKESLVSSADELITKGRELWEEGIKASAPSQQAYYFKAVAYFKQAIVLDPLNGDYHAFLSRLLLALEEGEQSRTEAEEAVRLSPNSFEAWNAFVSSFAELWVKIQKGNGMFSGIRSPMVEGKLDKAAKEALRVFTLITSTPDVTLESALRYADQLVRIAELQRIRGGYPCKALYEAVANGLTPLKSKLGDNDEMEDLIALAQGVLASKKLH